MKKNLLLTLMVAAIFSVNSSAQLNAGFEFWGASFAQPIEPISWITANTFASPLLTFPNPNPNPTSAFKDSTPAYAGNYSLKLVTVNLAYNPDTNTIPNRIGIALQGSITTTPTFNIKDRIPFTGRPSNIAFAAKYTPTSTDTAWCFFELTKWNGTWRDTIAVGWWYSSTTTGTYRTYNLSPIYNPLFPNSYPDSMHLSFSSSSLWAAQAGSTFYVDGINITGWNSVQDISLASQIKTYPNPATSNITISAEIDNASHVILYDCIGKTIGTYEINDKKLVINTSEFAAGSYYYSVATKEGQILTGGNFNVAK